MQQAPTWNLRPLVNELLSDGLMPVNTVALTMTDIHNAYRNADEHIFLCFAIDPDGCGPADAGAVKEALSQMLQLARRIRHAAKMLLLWRRVPLANPVADKYRKAIAESYPAMLEAGSVLVRIDEPRNVNAYNSLARNNYE